MLHGFFIIVGCQLIGEVIVMTTDFPIPGAVLGMIILLVGISIKGYITTTLDEAASILIKNLGLLFIPSGAGISIYITLIANQWDIILIASVTSTILTLVSCAWVFKILDRKQKNVQ